MKKKILIVEDDPDILLILNVILHEAGYEVDCFPRGKPVVEGKYDTPDLFILDRRIPDIDGVEICKYLKSQGTTRDIPIIMVSASPGINCLAKRAGAEGFLEKPFRVEDLLNKVAQCMH